MIRGQYSSILRIYTQRTFARTAGFSSSTLRPSLGPNAPLELDPSLQELLRDADMALLKHRPQENVAFGSSGAKELEVLEFDESWAKEPSEQDENEVAVPRERKSARAKFGSRSIGSVYIPHELRGAIETVINEGDKPRLREDAKRLFRQHQKDGSDIWHTSYEAEYKSWKQTRRHADRDGTALASIALPAHYSAVYAVLDNVKHRLGDDWKVRNVIDWGSGVGTGLWASMHVFQETNGKSQSGPHSDILLSRSTLSSYLALERREALSSMAKRLVKDTDLGVTEVRWRRGYSDAERIYQSDGGDVLALSAFHLSSLPNSVARKELVKQIWSSGAHVIALIDHDTSAGFASIAEAREQLLHLGRKEQEDPGRKDNPVSGCHAVAPCPHDGSCPLLTSAKSNLKCSFSQRLQRPAFLRKTKHVQAGHEDIGYSYVVIRRGKRPSSHQSGVLSNASSQDISTDPDSHNIRLEAYSWPRMVFPPLKRSGHVIIDGCTAEGKIMRMTIPRSQGKQPYYDARKSLWGDIFPHKPKNPPQVRMEPKSEDDDPSLLPGSDIGKRGTKQKTQDPTSYVKIISDIQETNKTRRRNWAKAEDSVDEVKRFAS